MNRPSRSFKTGVVVVMLPGVLLGAALSLLPVPSPHSHPDLVRNTHLAGVTRGQTVFHSSDTERRHPLFVQRVGSRQLEVRSVDDLGRGHSEWLHAWELTR